MTLAEIIEEFAEDVTRRRFAAGAEVKGVWTEGAPADTTIRAAVQPVSGKELLLLAEGLRTKRTKKLYSASDFRTADAPSNVAGDQFIHDGVTYDVHVVETWKEDGETYYKALGAEVGQ